MKEFDDSTLKDKRPLILKLEDNKNNTPAKYMPPKTLGRPVEGQKGYKEVMAMDESFKNILSKSMITGIYGAFPTFIGYGLLSNLSQEALIRAGVETIADDMTRKPIELYYDDDSGKEKEDLINNINSDIKKYKVKDTLNGGMLKDGYFGGCLIYIDVGELDDEEKEEPLVLDTKTFKEGSLRGFKVIEPVNISPGTYNTTDPTDEHYFKPEWWYIQGRRYHASRFLYIAGNDTPLLLKPAYNFFGIPQAQLALDYVANFVANRESAQELLNKFSLTCFGTDMSQGLKSDGSWADLVKRMKMFNKLKNNNGTFVYNKETEEMSQINTPLGGVRDIVDMSLNLLTAIWRIPKIRYIGEGEGGLNASSSEQMRSYYDYILAMQEKVLTEPYSTILKVLQLNRGLEPDEKLMFKFPSLWEMDEKERAELNKTQADRDAIYLANGVISQEEVRQRLSLDRYSGYTMIDVEDVPEPQEQPIERVDEEEQDEEDREAMDSAFDRVVNRIVFDEFVESDHPREKNGRFAKKGGGEQPAYKKNKTGKTSLSDSEKAKYQKGNGESIIEYAKRFDESDIDEDGVLSGLETYVSEMGETHSKDDMKKAIDFVERKIASGEETIDKFRLSGRRNQAVYSDERKEIHKKIARDLLSGKKRSKNPTFILLGGRGGSGKSQFKNEVYNEKDFVVLDADKIKEMLPEYKGWNAAHLHEESADILESVLSEARRRGLNVVLDATMNGLESTQRRLNMFKDDGYRTEMHYMFLPRQKAARRAITRFVDRPNGRYVPINTILGMKNNEENFEKLKGSVDAYSFSNNDVPFGKLPVLVEKSGDFYYNGERKWI